MKNYTPLILIIALSALAYGLGLHHYLTLETLKTHSGALNTFIQNHFLLATLIFLGVYIAVIGFSLPVATFMTLLGGFLFDRLLGTFIVVIAATIGASLIFWVVKYASEGFTKKAGTWVKKMEKGFRANAFYYMLTLRLVPLFPFVIVNIVPGLLQVPFKTYFWATFLGIIPGSFVYVSLGVSLRAAIHNPSFSVILDPKFFLAFIGLGLLSLVPVAYKFFKKNP